MKQLIKYLLISLITLSLSACGGGGGGGGGGSASNNTLPRTGIRIINGSIDAPPLDILMAGASTNLTKTRFATSSGYASVTAGEVGVILKKGNTEEVLSNPTVSLEANSRKSILFAGDYRNAQAQSFELNDNPGDLNAGSSKVRIVNAVQGLRGFEAKVGSSDGEIISLGSASSYVEVPAGVVTFSAISQLGGVASGSFTVEENKPYTILVTGEWGYFITTALLIG